MPGESQFGIELYWDSKPDGSYYMSIPAEDEASCREAVNILIECSKRLSTISDRRMDRLIEKARKGATE